MGKLTSRKLVGAVVSMLSIVGLVIGSAVVTGVEVEVLLTAVALIAGLGGYQIHTQGSIDRKI